MLETKFEYDMTERLVFAIEKIANNLEQPRVDEEVIKKALIDTIQDNYSEDEDNACYSIDLLAKGVYKALKGE